MTFRRPLAIALMALAMPLMLASPAANAAEQTFFPNQDVAGFLVLKLDLASFRNSLGPMRTETRRTFSELGMAVTSSKPDEVVIDTENWHYRLRVLRRADINRDGVEDVEVCFTEESKLGSYRQQQPLLVTRYAHSGYAVALKYEVEGCKSSPRPR